MSRYISSGGIDLRELQNVIYAHPEGLTSQEVSGILFGDTDKEHVTSVLHACETGMRNGLIDIRKRRANMSMYSMWYPPSVDGVPMTELEKCAYRLRVFTPRKLGIEYYNGKSVASKGFRKIERYIGLMVDDGTLIPTGEPNEYRWIG